MAAVCLGCDKPITASRYQYELRVDRAFPLCSKCAMRWEGTDSSQDGKSVDHREIAGEGPERVAAVRRAMASNIPVGFGFAESLPLPDQVDLARWALRSLETLLNLEDTP